MKLLATLRNKLRLKLNNRGQGATEYILLLVVLVGVVMIFKNKITSTLKGKMDSLAGDIENVKADGE